MYYYYLLYCSFLGRLFLSIYEKNACYACFAVGHTFVISTRRTYIKLYTRTYSNIIYRMYTYGLMSVARTWYYYCIRYLYVYHVTTGTSFTNYIYMQVLRVLDNTADVRKCCPAAALSFHDERIIIAAHV